MKIKSITDEEIVFDNGNKITYDHMQDCCEYNYADFKQIEESALKTVFDDELVFESVNDFGFRFGSSRTSMFFIPCYSIQNGYYSSHIDIYYNGEKVTSLICEEKIY